MHLVSWFESGARGVGKLPRLSFGVPTVPTRQPCTPQAADREAAQKAPKCGEGSVFRL